MPKRKFTKEHREKLSAAKAGSIPWNKGKKLTETHKKNLSVSHKGQKAWHAGKKGIYSPETLKAMRLKKLGCKLTEEHRRKIGEAQEGDKSHFWRGGVAMNSSKFRSLKSYRRLKKKVFERDNNRCVQCGTSSNLIIDHIKPSKHFPELRAVESNLRVLCHTCHVATPTFGIKVHSYA